MLRFFFVLVLCLLSFSSNASPPINNKITRVIYVTFDGTRWQDIFLDHSHFKKFWKTYSRDAALYGEPGSNKVIEVASTPISLPSYQSQMTGAIQPCENNNCGRVKV